MIYLCVFAGGWKCHVCLEEPLLPALWWDSSIGSDAVGRTNQKSGLREGWSHWLLYTSEQESQKCMQTWDLPISILSPWSRLLISTLPSFIFLLLTEQEPGSVHFYWGCPGAKGYGVAVAPWDSESVQQRAASVWDQLHHPRGRCWSAAEHHSWRHEGKQLTCHFTCKIIQYSKVSYLIFLSLSSSCSGRLFWAGWLWSRSVFCRCCWTTCEPTMIWSCVLSQAFSEICPATAQIRMIWVRFFHFYFYFFILAGF